MLDRFLISQRSWIILGTFFVLMLNGWRHLNGYGANWLDVLAIVLGIGFSLYNILFVVNWHRVSDRLVREVQALRRQQNFPTLPSKEIWYRQKVVSLVGIVIGLLMALFSLFAMLAVAA
jgi:hypothetical protein